GLRRLRARTRNLLVVEEVPLQRCALLGERGRGGTRQQVEQAPDRDRLVLQRVDRRSGQVDLEVVELEDRGLADQLRRDRGILDACELDDDLVLALLPDLGL